MKKLMENEFDIKPEPTTISEIFAKVRDLTKLQAELKRIKFVFDCQSFQSICFITDSRRLTQVILNLVTNALKYTFEGEVRITAKIEKSVLFVEVKDTGIGIEPEKLANIFQMFGLIEHNAKHNATGVGIGLFLCKRIITYLKGEILINSEKDKGTSCKLSVPISLNSAMRRSSSNLDLVFFYSYVKYKIGRNDRSFSTANSCNYRWYFKIK